MAMLKCRLKDLIVLGLWAPLILLPYFLMMHTPTAVMVQNALANRLNYFMGTNTDAEGRDLVSDEGEPFTTPPNDENENVIAPWVLANITGANYTAIEEEFPGLSEILEKTALPNNTVLMTALNAAWASEDSMIDLFLGSFHAGEEISHYLNHLLIIALDQVSYDRCLEIHPHCFRLETEGVDFAAEKFFMSGDYLRMMWRRVEFLRIVLELGYNLVFSDADIMWFRDPFPHFSEEADFQIACDHFNGNPTDLTNLPNGGFVFVRSSQRTVDFYKYWHESRLVHPTQHDQDVFNYIKKTKQFAAYQLQIEFLETSYYGGFCEVSQDFSKVCTMHANCCTGLERKLFDLKLTISDWAQYQAMTRQQRAEQRIFWQAPKECLHSW
ncbi:unnamed protein product [Calypogeia fissa]